jgi:hypothetical protein
VLFFWYFEGVFANKPNVFPYHHLVNFLFHVGLMRIEPSIIKKAERRKKIILSMGIYYIVCPKTVPCVKE